MAKGVLSGGGCASRRLGLDIGTSSLKALLVSDEGEAIGRSSVDYDEEAIRSGAVAEQDPESWIRAARTAIEECLSAGQLPDAIGLVGQVPTLVLADASGRSVRKALTWQDNRAEDQAAELARTLGAAADHVGMDLPWSPSQLPAEAEMDQLSTNRAEPGRIPLGVVPQGLPRACRAEPVSPPDGSCEGDHGRSMPTWSAAAPNVRASWAT